MALAGVAFGFLIGLSLGLLGGGGSILTVPVFVYVLGFAPKESIAMSLAVVGATSVIGALLHWRDGHVKLRVAASFGAVAVVGAYGGSYAARYLTGTEQLVIFACVMLVAAGVMLRERRALDVAAAVPSGARLPAAFSAALGLIVGVLTGLVGVGGGFLIVPALVWSGLPMSDAVGTSLVVITMNSVAGILGHLEQLQITWLAVALVTAGTMPGIAAGAYTMRYVPQRTLRRAFAILLLGLSVYMLYANMGARS